MKIEKIQAYPISFPIPEEHRVTLGIGQTIKRDAVLVKVTTDSGIVGWGEAHAARAPSAMAELINTTLQQLVVGRDPHDTESIWDYVYRMQIASHGMGTAAVIGLSGIDLALWDIKAKSAEQPLHQILGAESTPVESYAGGVSLGYQQPETLIEEIEKLCGLGYRAIKLRIAALFNHLKEARRYVNERVGVAVTTFNEQDSILRSFRQARRQDAT